MNGRSNNSLSFLRHMLLGAGFFLFPTLLFAQIEITEIMYDLEGTDTGREWIEVYNGGSSSVDVSTWKFFEGNTNHTLTPDGSGTLGPGAYAVIADDPAKFKADYSGFGGLLFDSSFSLSNEGELLEIKDAEEVVKDSVAYSSDDGALGNGNSLQKKGTSWIEAVPTPGKANASVEYIPPENNNEESGGSQKKDTSSSSSKESEYVPPVRIPPSLTVEIEGKTEVLAGSEARYKATAFNEKDRESEVVSFVWNFGDGSVGEGREVEHVYEFPGTYALVVNAKSAMQLEDEERLTVRVVEPSIVVEEVGVGEESFVQLKNETASEQDLSGWHVRVGSAHFTLPPGTFLLQDSSMIIPLARAGLQVTEGIAVSLHYPDGEVVDLYRWVEEVEEDEVSLQDDTEEVLGVATSSPSTSSEEGSADDFEFLNEESAIPATPVANAQAEEGEEMDLEKKSRAPFYLLLLILGGAAGFILFWPRTKKEGEFEDSEVDEYEIEEIGRH